jgi:hypothetical protein
MPPFFLYTVLMRRALATAAALAFLGASRHRAVAPEPPRQKLSIDMARSLVITDPAMLDGFDLQRVLQTLIERSGATATTPLSLYQQWFDTQNPKPGLVVADAPHCDDFITDGKPSLNGFPRRCPTPEGIFAKSDPFAARDYIPIGITNRFDVTPADGSNCGQYRIIFAKVTNQSAQRLHVIFEPVLPNPNPAAGASGCRAVAQFWADLSNVASMSERRTRVERFFFDGIDGFPPALRPEHFTKESGGRIRSMHQGGLPVSTRFYQFHLQRQGSRLIVTPGLLEDVPFARFFDASAGGASGDDFRKFFITQIATLAIKDVNGFFLHTPEKYIVPENDAGGVVEDILPSAAFQKGLFTPQGKAFNDAITAELQRVGSTIRPSDLIGRVQLMDCGGCHFGGIPVGEGVTFPQALAVQAAHIDESQETVSGAVRFAISPALRDVFAPNRAKILIDFLNGAPLPAHSN